MFKNNSFCVLNYNCSHCEFSPTSTHHRQLIFCQVELDDINRNFTCEQFKFYRYADAQQKLC
ncbi:MAG: hypothetical protein LBH59_03830 [Planctomycetaceae bacterium]|nr:hypothetical protein [Planctomycetaceae bacterium]